MRLFPIIKSSLLLVILTITISACSDVDQVNTATLNGTMILETRPVVEGGAEKFSYAAINAVVTTTANVTIEERVEGIFIEFLDWFGEGVFGPAPTITVKNGVGTVLEKIVISLHSGKISSGFVITGTGMNFVDKTGALGGVEHEVTVHVVVEIKEQHLEFIDLVLRGIGDILELVTPTDPLQWIDDNGIIQELRIQSIKKDLGPLLGDPACADTFNSFQQCGGHCPGIQVCRDADGQECTCV